jgi:hypothetical protein
MYACINHNNTQDKNKIYENNTSNHKKNIKHNKNSRKISFKNNCDKPYPFGMEGIYCRGLTTIQYYEKDSFPIVVKKYETILFNKIIVNKKSLIKSILKNSAHNENNNQTIMMNNNNIKKKNIELKKKNLNKLKPLIKPQKKKYNKNKFIGTNTIHTLFGVQLCYICFI